MVAPIINSTNSVNMSGTYISSHSNLSIESFEQMSQICLQVVALAGDTCWTNQTNVHWQVPNYSSNQNVTLVVNGTDLFGNTNQTTYVLRYHQTAPSLNAAYYTLESPGHINLNITSTVQYQVTLDGSIGQSSSNNQVYVNTDGKHTVNATLTDALGNSRTQTLTIVLDTTDPIVNLTLPTSVNVGRNSTIGIGMEETFSNISRFTLNITSNGVTCSYTNQINVENYSSTIRIQTVLSQNGCGLSLFTNYQITIDLTAVNEVGRVSQISTNTSFYGYHEPIYLTGMNYVQFNSTTILVSNYSSFTCSTNHPISTNLTIAILSGLATVNSMDVVLWENTSGVVRCSYTDALGNSVEQSWEVQFKTNDLQVNFSYLNNHGNVSKVGSNNIFYQSSSTHGINEVEIYTNGSLYQTTQAISGLIQFNLAEGYYNIEIIAKSRLGYASNYSDDIVLDGSQPTMEILNSTTINYNGSTSTMYAGNRNVTIDIRISESFCPPLPSIEIANGDLLSINQNVATISISSTQTQFTVELTDCVGWKQSKQVQIVRKSSINPGTISQHVSTHLSGNTVFSKQSGSFIFGTSDSLEINLDCYTSIGTVTCPNVGYNSWDISLSGMTSQGQLDFVMTDSIGNVHYQNYTVLSDLVAPTCTSNGIEIGGTIYVRTLSEITVTCQDGTSGLDTISIVHNSLTEQYDATHAAVKSVTFYTLVDETTLQIEAIDSVGNSYSNSYQISLDDVAPEISCRIGT